MSDGMSDAAAEGRIAGKLWDAAYDLREAFKKFAHAVKVARVGHRGYSVPRRFVLAEFNELLRETGFELVDRDPQRSWETYEDV